MTEYEYADLIATYSANAGTFFALYLTAISGFLISAFVAGSRLSSVQVAILNVGFIVASIVLIWGTYGAGMSQVHYTHELLSLAEDSPQANRGWVIPILTG